MKYILLPSIALFIFSCSSSGDEPQLDPETEERREKIEEHDQMEFTEIQKERKQNSMDYCAAYDVDVPESLPCTLGEDEVEIRTKEAIIDRMTALCYGGLKSEGLERAELDRFEEKYELTGKFTPNEQAFADAETPDQQQLIDANWKYEGVHVLLWASGFIDSLYFPNQVCNVAEDVAIIFDRSRDELLEQAEIRSEAEILDMMDRIYRLHWACVDNRIQGLPAPGGMDEGIVYEWHYALNWLIGYMGQEWDDITTDT